MRQDMHNPTKTSARGIRRAILALGGAALLAAGLVEFALHITAEPIADAREHARLAALQVVLPAARFDNALADDVVQVNASLLGPGTHRVYRARHQGHPVALIIEATAADGYAGPIELLASIDVSGRIIAVRVTRQQETPGLGDAIDAARGDWIEIFRGRNLADPPSERWKVRREGGEFDQLAGATISSRAVVEAVQRCLTLVDAHVATLFTAPSDAELKL